MSRGFLSTLLGVERKSATARATGAVMARPGTPYRQRWPVERAVTEGFERSIWVFRCIDAIASNASSLHIDVLSEHGEDAEPVADDDDEARIMRRLLNRRPNDYESAESFRYRMSAQMLLSKQGVFVEVVRGNGGLPAELHLLPPHRTAPVPGEDGTFVKEFEVRLSEGSGTQRVSADDVIWLRRPHPLDPYMSLTPLEAAGLSVDIDYYARIFNRNFLLNDGRPGGMVAVKGQVSDEDADEIKRRFSGGPRAAGKTTVIEAEGLDYIDTSSSPRDAQWSQALKTTRDDILVAFGVGESVIGNASGRTFANADAEFENFWVVTMKPHLDLLARPFTQVLSEERVLHYDVSGVSVLQRPERERHQKLLQEFQAGLITLDEYREGTGRDPFDRPASRALWIDQKMPVARDDEDEEALSAGDEEPEEEDPLAGLFSIHPDSGEGPGDARGRGQAPGVGDAGREAKEGQDPQGKADHLAPLLGDDRRQEMRDARDDELTQWEDRIRAVLRDLLTRQERVSREKLNGPKARRGTRHWTPMGTKDIDPDDIIDAERWREQARQDVSSLFSEMYLRVGERSAREMGAEDFVTNDDAVQASIGARVDRIAGAVESWASRQQIMIQEMDAQGYTIEEIGEALSEQYDTLRNVDAERATRSEANAMRNDSSIAGALAAGATHKQWLTVRDDRVRLWHQEADGQTVVLDEFFEVGPDMLRYPGDEEHGEYDNIANCRCSLLFEKRDDDGMDDDLDPDVPGGDDLVSTIDRIRNLVEYEPAFIERLNLPTDPGDRDEAMRAIMERQGFDREPSVVSEDRLWRYAQQRGEALRYMAFQDEHEATAYRYGEIAPPLGVLGAGYTLFAGADDEEARRHAREHGDYIEPTVLRSGTNRVTMTEILDRIDRLEDVVATEIEEAEEVGEGTRADYLRRLRAVLRDPGRATALLGYDALLDEETGDEVLVNRGLSIITDRR